jgi:hypothetical protein
VTERLEAAAKAYRRAEKRADETRGELYAAIVEADKAGVSQVDIVRATGYTRERVRQIVRAAKRGLDDA